MCTMAVLCNRRRLIQYLPLILDVQSKNVTILRRNLSWLLCTCCRKRYRQEREHVCLLLKLLPYTKLMISVIVTFFYLHMTCRGMNKIYHAFNFFIEWRSKKCVCEIQKMDPSFYVISKTTTGSATNEKNKLGHCYNTVGLQKYIKYCMYF